jgi:lysophospholipase L1-like esterase
VNPIILFFASGESLYPGTALLLFSVVTSAFSLPTLIVWLRRISMWVGLAFVIMASPPLPWSLVVLFGLVFLAFLISGHRLKRTHGWRRFHIASSVFFVLVLLIIPITEFAHRRLPEIQGETSDHLVVIGDSISAGLGTRVRAWPEVMQEMTGASITNLSRPGATMVDGLSLANRVTEQDHLVLIELGGNDLISGERSDDFESSLAEVLARLASPKRTIAMFELPLLPHMTAYGRVQRRLANRYGVWLIPKRFLTAVISGKDATSDGLHLTDLGVRRMASLVAHVLSPVLETR